MKRKLAIVSLVVRDYDEAIDFFVKILGFELIGDREVPEQNKRWVVQSAQQFFGRCKRRANVQHNLDGIEAEQQI